MAASDPPSALTNGHNPLVPEVEKKLDPTFVKYYNEVINLKPATHQVPLQDVRANPEKYTAPWVTLVPETDRIRDRTISSKDGYEIPVRIYHPDPAISGPGPYGVHLNFHGGGFVFGGLVPDAKFCANVSEKVGLVVMDVNYRHCPEATFDKCIEDSWVALNWARNNAKEINIHPNAVSISGISAGGHICAVLQHMCRDIEIPLRLAVLAVPVVTDFATYEKPSDSPFPSFREFSRGAMLNWERMKFFGNLLFPTNKELVRASIPRYWLQPLDAPNFSGLCETFLITAECDPVRDEGETYGRKVHEAGAKVTFKRYLGMPHPFMHMTAQLEQARQYDRDVLGALSMAHMNGH